ncbi:alpha/beta fold hydrolase [Streptomyces sp. GS7]|uniref:alpha/beta fold hydrolase n=1 Tax=Streptomyces sp. GS7 TaxID=2692234 RepID=UPI002E2A57FE|nr:alpha/beta hydrolase [Streptomyces sp. GS7]
MVLPGITGPAVAMDFVARELTDLVRPLVVDVRGRGLSDGESPGPGGGGGGYGLAAYAEDTEAVSAALAPSRPVLFGHSTGGRIAVAGSWPRRPRREQELRARRPSSRERRAVVATHRGFATEDFFDRWPPVPGPAALPYGADSPAVTAVGAEEARALLPSASFTAVPDAGHMILWGTPSAAPRAAPRPMLGWAPSAGRAGGAVLGGAGVNDGDVSMAMPVRGGRPGSP